jgi:uncharacterized glyoxalase superfamily protein PhnB
VTLEGHATVLLVEDVRRSVEYYVYVDDVDALHEELARRGADLLGPPARRGYGMYDFRVRDPHGYVLAFGRAT